MTFIDVSHHNPIGDPSAAEAVVIRGSYGMKADAKAAGHIASARATPRLWYWYPLSRLDPVAQARLGFTTAGAYGLRGFSDLEESTANDGAEPVFPRYSDAYFQHVNAGLLEADRLTGLVAGIYGSASWLNWWFTAAQQAQWVHRPLWNAHWQTNGFPSLPDMPWGWKAAGWALWQTGKGPFPGMVGNIDQSRRWPGMSLAELLGKVSVMPTGKTKLGLHHGLGGRDAKRWATVATVMKYVGDLGASNDAPPGVLCVGRVVDDGAFAGQGFDANRMEQTIDPQAAAREYVAFLLEKIRLNPRIDIWEGPNEQVITSQDVMAWYGAFCHEFARLIQGLGKRAGLGSWATGTPAFNLWPFYTLALQATVDFNAVLCRHEYGPLDGYLSLRYRVDQREYTRLGYPNVPVIITECGGDAVPGSGPWRRYYLTIGRYWDELLHPYAIELERDAYLLGATVFTDGGGWPDFDVSGTGLVDKVIAYAGGVVTVPPPIGDDEVDKAKIRAQLAIIDAATAAILAELADAPPPALHTLADKSNQAVINLFNVAFGTAYIAKLTAATDEAFLFANRGKLYTGPAVENMPGLTPADKAALIANL